MNTTHAATYLIAARTGPAGNYTFSADGSGTIGGAIVGKHPNSVKVPGGNGFKVTNPWEGSIQANNASDPIRCPPSIL